MGDQEDMIRELRREARARSWSLEVLYNRGAGSHCLVRMNGRTTIVPRRIGKGLRRKILSDLGLL